MHFFGDGDATKGPTYVLSDHETEKYVPPLPPSPPPCLPPSTSIPCVLHNELLPLSLSLTTSPPPPPSLPPSPPLRARYWLPCVDLPIVRTTATFHLTTLPQHLAFANGVLIEDGMAEAGAGAAAPGAASAAVEGGEE